METVMDKLYKFFISSTYEDLKSERKEVIGCVLDSHNFPIAMEQFPASPSSQWEYIKKEIDTTDYYILIVGGKYGSIDEVEQISYTEKEFNYARSKQIPVIAFMIKDIDALLGAKIEKDPVRIEKLNSFRNRLLYKEGILIKFFSDVQNLKYEVIQSIHQIIKDNPRPGWVRGELSTKNTLTPVKKDIDFTWIDISGYISSEKQISKYTAPSDGTVEITIEKNYEMTLINETKKCPGQAVELTNGNKILKLSCSKNDEIKLEHNPNWNFKLISAKFYAVMNKK